MSAQTPILDVLARAYEEAAERWRKWWERWIRRREDTK